MPGCLSKGVDDVHRARVRDDGSGDTDVVRQTKRITPEFGAIEIDLAEVDLESLVRKDGTAT